MIQQSFKTNLTKKLKLFRVCFGFIFPSYQNNKVIGYQVFGDDEMNVTLASRNKKYKNEFDEPKEFCMIDTFNHNKMMKYPKIAEFFWKEFQEMKKVIFMIHPHITDITWHL